MIDRQGLAIAAALGASIAYGFAPVLTRAAFENGIPATESVFFRTIAITAVLAAVAVARRSSFALPRAALPSFALLAAATILVSFGYMASVQFIPVGLAVIIFYTYPVLILLAAPVIEGHAPGAARIAIAVIAFAGLAIAIGPGFGSLDARGIALAAMGAAGATLQAFSGRVLSRHLGSVVFASLIHAAILPIVLGITLWVGGGTLRTVTGQGVDGTAYLILAGVAIAYLLAYFMHMQALRHAPASIVAPFFNLEPVVASAIAAVLLGESLALQQYLGGLVVLAALVASSLIGLRRPLRG